MKTKTMFVLMVIGALALCFVATQPAIASDEEEILKVGQTFAKAMNEADLNVISSLWLNSPETSMYTPSSNGAFLTSGYEGIVAFFKTMFEMPAGMFALSSYNSQVNMLGDKLALVTEYYVLTVNPPDTEEQFVYQMRGSVVVENADGKWLIVHAHWSDLPTE